MVGKVEIEVKAGNGGDGAISFRKEKYVPFGGPDGGDGGKGGNVVFKADPGINTLRMFRHKRTYRAENGGPGMGKKKHGRAGDDLVLAVPAGTVVSYRAGRDGDSVIADLDQAGRQVVVARGGKGGMGNSHFTTSTNQAPRIAEKGERGQESSVILELRLIADVGIIGYPNVGKSTLLSAASAARPKIASYPFTTREPVLGVVEVGRQSFIMAEIPGLIDGAHLGRGLGHNFLRHALRTRVLIHLIDGSSETPVEDMVKVNNELSLFEPSLAQKPQIVAVNKIDLLRVQARMSEIRRAFTSAGLVPYFISAETGRGVPELMAEAMKMLDRTAERVESVEKSTEKIFRPQPRGARVSVLKEGDVFVVEAPQIERILQRSSIRGSEVRWQLERQLSKAGVNKALLKAGIRPGDKVRVGKVDWEW
jgi:GTP-binding protein